jgi:MATE family multidrug resistance protein
LVAGDWMLSLYRIGSPDENSLQAVILAQGLLGFVASYVLVDAVQLILAAALKGAGDTWFVLAAGATTSFLSIVIGVAFDPGKESLTWWWWVITLWIWTLAITMTIRFLGGRWKSMRMV